MVIILATIVLPQALMQPSSFNQSISNIRQYFTFGTSSAISLILPEGSAEICQHLNLFFSLVKGWMEKTYLFTGFYFNKTLIYGDSHQHYNMPVAFLLATAAYFTITLIAMVKYTAIGMRNQRMSGEKFYDYCNKVFSGWDFSLSKDKAAAHKHKNLFHEYSNDLEEARQKLRREGMSIGRKSCILFFRAVIWIVTLAILAASGYLIYQIVDVWMPMRVQDNAFVYLVVEFLPSIAITALNVIVPVIFQQVVGLEDYEPHNEIRITIGRTVFLRLASVAVLAVTLGSVITCSDDVRECGNCGVSMVRDCCWETYVGQQIYKLVIVDFFVVVAITFFVEFPRKLTVDKFSEVKVVKMVGRQEFDIPKNVLDIVYSQTLCWIGTFFCPLIAIITVMKFFIFFYVKKLTLLKNCIPASRTYRASKSSYFFMSVLMVSFVLCAAAVAYAVGRQGCGPFRIYSSREFFMFESFSDLVSTLPNLIRDIFYFCGSWLFYVSVLIVLSLVIYYYRAMAAANKRLLSLLRYQLSQAGKDRQFLLSQVNDALLRGDLS
ncbi:hypothetical protein CAPTEDRAFT_150917 [Capitella teleta]|uniref:TMC domain-containing protein n=1 Tax=Capitella teleta TaxID=283909 RepID=R7TRC5_CAPTE|nr:hypothetical protein CAPTEDRAFT_150917 [Capitella teleta]|eukprot:ELT96458.1 hypothetical protein CAPTEDRAFT_150917 [Capitella teleta]